MPEAQPFSVRDMLPQPPEGTTVITGDQGLIFDAKNQFEEDILDYLGVVKRARDGRIGLVQRESFALSFRNMEDNPTGHVPEEEEAYRDDYFFRMKVMDIPVTGSSIQSDTMNYLQGAFAHYLTPGRELDVRGRLSRSGSELPSLAEIRAKLKAFEAEYLSLIEFSAH